MRQLRFAIALAASIPLSAAAQPMVQSQEGIALENQILQLQNQIQQLQSQVQQGAGTSGSALGGNTESAPPNPGGTTATPASGDIMGNLLNQVSQLQAEIQQLNGRVDTLQNQVDTQHAATEKEIGDLTFKLTGAAPGAAPGAAAPPGAPQAPGNSAGTGSSAAAAQPAPSSQPALTGKAALAAAQAALARHDYATAEADARAVLSAGKSAPGSYQAQFILAKALYGAGKPQDAAIAYDDAYSMNRAGSEAPAALLGLANSFIAIQQLSAACDTLATLNSQFPTPPANLSAGIQAAQARAKCN